ncbi:MAG: coiled-coil domain-containing protein [Candidatus Puniceispirillaceae bacterium]
MNTLAFDTHKFVKDLTGAGLTDSVAEVLANHYASLLNDRLTTKEDLVRLDEKLTGEMHNLHDGLKAEMYNLHDGLKAEMHNLHDGLRTEMHNLHDGLRTEMIGLNDNTQKDIKSLREEMHIGFAGMEERINSRMMVTVLSAQLVTIVTICTVTGLLLSFAN